MKILTLLLFLIPVIGFGQNRNLKFFSDYQYDKTYNGSTKNGQKKVSISFSDPKLITPKGADFDDLPRGYMTVKYEGLSPVKETIIYVGKNKGGNDIYAITNTNVDYDIIYVIKSLHKVGNKSYGYTILWGKADPNNSGGLPENFTALHCNSIK